MRIRVQSLLLACAALVVLGGCATAPTRPTTWEYRGFTIDESRVRNLSGLEGIRGTTKEQIDIVCAVGVPTDILQFFQGVPFILEPSDALPGATPGLYEKRNRSVRVTARIVSTGHKPVLLHELLHAYHDQRVPGGFGNRTIIGFYDRAKSIGAYDARSHMMQNEKEFFACAATTYLFDVTAQEPFKKDKIKENQPQFFAHLQTLFGPNAGNYLGSLTD